MVADKPFSCMVDPNQPLLALDGIPYCDCEFVVVEQVACRRGKKGGRMCSCIILSYNLKCCIIILYCARKCEPDKLCYDNKASRSLVILLKYVQVRSIVSTFRSDPFVNRYPVTLQLASKSNSIWLCWKVSNLWWPWGQIVRARWLIVHGMLVLLKTMVFHQIPIRSPISILILTAIGVKIFGSHSRRVAARLRVISHGADRLTESDLVTCEYFQEFIDQWSPAWDGLPKWWRLHCNRRWGCNTPLR